MTDLSRKILEAMPRPVLETYNSGRLTSAQKADAIRNMTRPMLHVNSGHPPHYDPPFIAEEDAEILIESLPNDL